METIFANERLTMDMRMRFHFQDLSLRIFAHNSAWEEAHFGGLPFREILQIFAPQTRRSCLSFQMTNRCTDGFAPRKNASHFKDFPRVFVGLDLARDIAQDCDSTKWLPAEK